MNCGHMCTISLYRFTCSHVQRMLVHVPMYTMYYLSVVLVLHKDVVRLCSYRVKGGGSYTFNLSDQSLKIIRFNRFFFDFRQRFFLNLRFFIHTICSLESNK